MSYAALVDDLHQSRELVAALVDTLDDAELRSR